MDRPTRDQVSEATKPVVRSYVEREAADSFAGMWIDHKSGGVVRVGFTENAQNHLAEIRKRAPYPDWIEVFEARYTLAELQQLKDRVSTDMRELELSTVAVAVELNAVEVGAAELTTHLERELRERYPGEPLHLTEQGPIEPM